MYLANGEIYKQFDQLSKDVVTFKKDFELAKIKREKRDAELTLQIKSENHKATAKYIYASVMSDEVYLKLLDDVINAEARYMAAKLKLDAMSKEFESWRTKESTKRAEMRL